MSLQCTQERRADSLNFRLDGHLDGTTVPGFEKELFAAIEEQPGRIAIDAGALAYVSSAGLGMLLRAARQMTAVDRRLALFGLSSDVRQVFEISGFAKVLAIHENEGDALGADPDSRS